MRWGLGVSGIVGVALLVSDGGLRAPTAGDALVIAAAVVRAVQPAGAQPACVEVASVSRGQVAALRYHGGLDVRAVSDRAGCPWRVTAADLDATTRESLRLDRWQLVATVRRPTDPKDNLRVWKRVP